jgi:glutathione synthase/RimK-type ligase-like ATP-grasp enzyme
MWAKPWMSIILKILKKPTGLSKEWPRMTENPLIGVYRESRFSPGKVDDDAAILDDTLTALKKVTQRPMRLILARDLTALSFRPNWVLSMAQSERALTTLAAWEKAGSRIINSSRSIGNCYRKPLTALLQKAALPTPKSRILPLEAVPHAVHAMSSGPFWLKRGDVHAVCKDDVVKVTDRKRLQTHLAHFRRNKIEEVLIQAHQPGAVFKFYGVGQGAYFAAFAENSHKPASAAFSELENLAWRAAAAAGLKIYGGDAILTPTGQWVLIDLNDWPSFGRCRKQAALAICNYISKDFLRSNQ